MSSKPTVTFADWEKLDIRLGTILAASNPEWSNKLIELTVDFGPEGQKTIFTGLRAWYAPEDFAGKQALFIINLEPRKMGPGVSEGMLVSLCDSTDGNSPPRVLLLEDLAAAGLSAC